MLWATKKVTGAFAPGMQDMNIGQAASAAAVPAKRIRYYEKIGLIKAVDRSESGYRVYKERDVHTLRFIRRARGLGFSMEQIATLLALWHDQARSSAVVKNLAATHIQSLQKKIGELQSIVDTLTELSAGCHGDSRPECPILTSLQGDES